MQRIIFRSLNFVINVMLVVCFLSFNTTFDGQSVSLYHLAPLLVMFINMGWVTLLIKNKQHQLLFGIAFIEFAIVLTLNHLSLCGQYPAFLYLLILFFALGISHLTDSFICMNKDKPVWEKKSIRKLFVANGLVTIVFSLATIFFDAGLSSFLLLWSILVLLGWFGLFLHQRKLITFAAVVGGIGAYSAFCSGATDFFVYLVGCVYLMAGIFYIVLLKKELPKEPEVIYHDHEWDKPYQRAVLIVSLVLTLLLIGEFIANIRKIPVLLSEITRLEQQPVQSPAVNPILFVIAFPFSMLALINSPAVQKAAEISGLQFQVESAVNFFWTVAAIVPWIWGAYCTKKRESLWAVVILGLFFILRSSIFLFIVIAYLLLLRKDPSIEHHKHGCLRTIIVLVFLPVVCLEFYEMSGATLNAADVLVTSVVCYIWILIALHKHKEREPSLRIGPRETSLRIGPRETSRDKDDDISLSKIRAMQNSGMYGPFGQPFSDPFKHVDKD